MMEHDNKFWRQDSVFVAVVFLGIIVAGKVLEAVDIVFRSLE